MPLTSNAALAWVNLFDSAAVTASSAAASTPASNLQVAHVAKKWRGTGGTTDNFTATWTADQTADTFGVFGLGSTFLATGTVRLQLTSNGGGAGDVYDSTAQAGIVDPLYGYAIHLLTSKTFRSAKWTFAQAGASYIEAGRAFAGLRTQATYNFAPGASRKWVDLSKVTQSKGGQDYIDRAAPGMFREWDVKFDWVDATQRNSLWEALDIANGIHTDLLFISDPTSTNLGRDCVWGRMTEIDPVTMPFTGTDLFARQFRIKERM
jgi:hypothetical protein